MRSLLEHLVKRRKGREPVISATLLPVVEIVRQGSSPHVVVIVLTYNNWEETFQCLESLSTVTYPNLEIVIVDNDSANPPLDQVKEMYPEVSIIRSESNLGYAGGNNVGLKYALDRSAEFALVLNHDTILSPDFLTFLIEAAVSEPQAAFLGPMVYHFDEPGVIQSAGGFMTAEWRSYHRGQNETDAGQYDTPRTVTWVTGCAIMARCDKLGRIGLLDPRFFLYNEEVDWCLRAREAGFKVLFVPKSKVWHKGVQRQYEPSPRITYLSARNELYLLVKHNAGKLPLTLAVLRHLRTLASWSIRPRWRNRRRHRDALAYALRDFAQGRLGAPPMAF